MKEQLVVVGFKTTEAVKKLIELIAKKQGKSKSEFLAVNSIDNAMNFERVRHIDTISDAFSILAVNLTLDMDKESAQKILNKMTTIQQNYIKQRLEPHMRLQRHLTDIAIRSYLQDYAEEMEGIDGFVINQSLQAIYDRLKEYGIITHEEWEEKNQHYNLYMEEVGSHLMANLQQE